MNCSVDDGATTEGRPCCQPCRQLSAVGRGLPLIEKNAKGFISWPWTPDENLERRRAYEDIAKVWADNICRWSAS